MSNFIDYSQILADFRSALEGATLINGLSLRKVFKNASDTDFALQNMPMADCRLKRNDPENIAGRTYWHSLTIEVEIACFDLTSRDICATMRDGLTNAVQRYFQENPRFSASIDTIQIGPVDFETGETQDQGEFIAASFATFIVKLYSET